MKLISSFTFFCLFNLIFLLPHSVAKSVTKSVEQSETDEELSEMLELMDILDEETSIATKTKMNSDYVPGMVTVLTGDDMQALGKLTVWEALSLVPGLKILKTNEGTPLLIARGTPFPFNSGNIKIMLNSTTMTSEVSGLNSSLLLMPIEQVERIEFIRGPSSAIYGNSAYMGLLNIITYKDRKQVYLNSVDGPIKSGGGSYFWQDTEKDLQVNANLFVQKDNDANYAIDASGAEDKTSFILGIDYKKTSLNAQFFEENKVISGVRSTVLNSDEQAVSVSLSQKINFSDHLDSKLQLSHRDNQFDDNKIYQGSVTRAEMDFNLDIIDKHQLLLSLAFEHYIIDEATLCIARDVGVLSCPRGVTSDLMLSEQWNAYSLSIQDQFILATDLVLTAGLALNHDTNLNETNITPRLAFVWTVAEHHILKAQYTQGFRSPTYFELYDKNGNKNDLQSEQVESYELGYIYKKNNYLGRITLFHSSLDDLIFPRSKIAPDGRPTKDTTNDAQHNTSGIEFEWEQKINALLKWSFNVSYNDSNGDRNELRKHDSDNGVSEWMGNLVLYIQPKENVLLTTHLYHVGEQTWQEGVIDGYNQVDLTLNLSRFITKKITFRLGVKNALDESILYIDTKPSTITPTEYSGRTWWAQFSYQL